MSTKTMTTRRAILAGGAAAAMLPAAAAAGTLAPDDPVFAAIEHHRLAVAITADPIFAAIERHRELMKASDDLDDAIEEAKLAAGTFEQRPSGKRALLDWDGRHEITSLRNRYDALREQEDVAADHLALTMPTSAAGCAALVAYAAASLEFGEGPEWPLPSLANVVEALKVIAVQS